MREPSGAGLRKSLYSQRMLPACRHLGAGSVPLRQACRDAERHIPRRRRWAMRLPVRHGSPSELAHFQSAGRGSSEMPISRVWIAT